MTVDHLQSLYNQSQGDESPSTSTICGECNPTEANSCPDSCLCTGSHTPTARRQSNPSSIVTVRRRSNRSAVIEATEACEAKQKKASKPKPKKKAAATTKATTTATSKSNKKTTSVKKPKEAATKSKKKAAVSSCLYLYLPLFVYSL